MNENFMFGVILAQLVTVAVLAILVIKAQREARGWRETADEWRVRSDYWREACEEWQQLAEARSSHHTERESPLSAVSTE